MPKPSNVMNLKTRPRRTISEEAAQRLEAAAEAQGNRIAGTVATAPVSVAEPAPVATPEPAPPPEAIAPVEVAAPEQARVPEQVPAPAQRTAPDAEARDHDAGPAPAASDKPVGTMNRPRVRRDGVRTRSTTVHLPVALGQQLRMHCAQTDRRQNDVIVRALIAYLDDPS